MGRHREGDDCSTDVLHFGRVPIGCAGARGGSGLFDNTLKFDDDFGGDLIPEQASRVDVSSGFALALLSHGGKSGSKVAAVRRLRTRRQRVAEVVTSDAIPGATEVHGGHTVVLSRRDGEELLVLLFLACRSELVVQLVESRSSDATNVRFCPGDAGWTGFYHGRVIGDNTLFRDGGCDTGIFEDAVENLRRSGTNLIGHTRDRRSNGARGLAGDESTTQE